MYGTGPLPESPSAFSCDSVFRVKLRPADGAVYGKFLAVQ